MEIIPYDSQYKEDFRILNEQWLKKYFVVEPYDSEVLLKCEETILKPGGFIFFVRKGENIVGTAAFIYRTKGVYELSKMAVSPDFQGQKIGQYLMRFLIDFAERHHWQKLILYSNIRLKPAIYLYQKFGFIEVSLEKESYYARADIKMELEL